MLRTRVDCRLEKKNSIKRFRSLALLLSLQRFPFRFEKFPRSNRTNPSPFPFFPPPPISTQLFPRFLLRAPIEGRKVLSTLLPPPFFHTPFHTPIIFPFKGKKPFSTRVNKSSRREGKKKKGRERRKRKKFGERSIPNPSWNGTMHPLVPIYELQKRLRPRFRAKVGIRSGANIRDHGV